MMLSAYIHANMGELTIIFIYILSTECLQNHIQQRYRNISVYNYSNLVDLGYQIDFFRNH